MFSRTSQLIRLPSSILRQIAHRPMDQCAGLTFRQPFERLGGPRFVARQLLVLTHQPSDQGSVPEFWGEVQPPASLKGLDIPSRRAVFVPWKPSRRPAFGMGNPTFR